MAGAGEGSDEPANGEPAEDRPATVAPATAASAADGGTSGRGISGRGISDGDTPPVAPLDASASGAPTAARRTGQRVLLAVALVLVAAAAFALTRWALQDDVPVGRIPGDGAPLSSVPDLSCGADAAETPARDLPAGTAAVPDLALRWREASSRHERARRYEVFYDRLPASDASRAQVAWFDADRLVVAHVFADRAPGGGWVVTGARYCR